MKKLCAFACTIFLLSISLIAGDSSAEFRAVLKRVIRSQPNDFFEIKARGSEVGSTSWKSTINFPGAVSASIGTLRDGSFYWHSLIRHSSGKDEADLEQGDKVFSYVVDQVRDTLGDEWREKTNSPYETEFHNGDSLVLVYLVRGNVSVEVRHSTAN